MSANRKICQKKCALAEPTLPDLLDMVARLRETMARDGIDLSVDIKVKPLGKEVKP